MESKINESIVRSYGVVSLLEMLQFRAHRFISMSGKMASVEAQWKGRPSSEVLVTEENGKTLRASIIELRQELNESLMDSSVDMVDRILGETDVKTVTVTEYGGYLFELRRRIEDDLKRKVFYQLRPEVAKLFSLENPFGDAVATNFRTAAHDIQEAAKCYSCERYDATAFHLMRAMESPLRCLAKTLHIRYSPGWAGYLNRIDKKLRNPKIRLSKSRKDFLSNASTLLWAVKDAWRNETMHLEATYGPDQTARIFESVKAFMMHLATELREGA